MARLGRKPVRPGRVTLAVSLGTFGLFIISMGAGLTSWPLGAVGVAMLIVAIALLTTASMRATDKAYVSGTIHVVKVSEPPLGGADFGRCEMQVMVDAPGHPGQNVVIRDPRVPVVKWPDVGETLPALIAVGDPRRIKIQWDRVGRHGERFESRGYSEDQFDNASYLSPAFGEGSYDEPVSDDGLNFFFNEDPEDRASAYRPGSAPTAEYRPSYRDAIEYPDLPPYAPSAGSVDVDAYIPDPYTAGAHDVDPYSDDPYPYIPPQSAAPEPATPAAGRRPSPHPRDEPAPAPVLEGELLASGVPAPRFPPDSSPYDLHDAEDQDDVNLIDFTGLSEPAEPLATEPFGTGPFAAEPSAAELPDWPAYTGPAQPSGSAATATGTVPESAAEDVDDLFPAEGIGSVGSIHGVGLTLLVADLARSVAFYRDLLGFYEIDGGTGSTVLASGDTRIVLRSTVDVAPVNRRLVHLNLEVGDVNATHRDLKARGVRFTYAPRVVNRGERLELWAAAFKDPDGHGIAITQWRARAS